jgi:hypothetical protein
LCVIKCVRKCLYGLNNLFSFTLAFWCLSQPSVHLSVKTQIKKVSMITFQCLYNLEHIIKVCHGCFVLSVCFCGLGIFASSVQLWYLFPSSITLSSCVTKSQQGTIFMCDQEPTRNYLHVWPTTNKEQASGQHPTRNKLVNKVVQQRKNEQADEQHCNNHRSLLGTTGPTSSLFHTPSLLNKDHNLL